MRIYVNSKEAAEREKEKLSYFSPYLGRHEQTAVVENPASKNPKKKFYLTFPVVFGAYKENPNQSLQAYAGGPGEKEQYGELIEALVRGHIPIAQEIALTNAIDAQLRDQSAGKSPITISEQQFINDLRADYIVRNTEFKDVMKQVVFSLTHNNVSGTAEFLPQHLGNVPKITKRPAEELNRFFPQPDSPKR